MRYNKGVNEMGFIKVNKTKAKRLYDDGETVYLVPCKVFPDFNNNWIQPIKAKKSNDTDFFENFVNNFEYYNCQLNETGKYTHFYILDK